jgi:hypothetical protein
MAHVDLHLHTSYSDGSLSPRETVEEAARRGVRVIAITDHDELGGIPEARAAGGELGVTVISGVEINTDVGREDVHILGYGFPPDAPALRRTLEGLRAGRLERARKMLARLAELGRPLKLERVLAIAGHGSIGRPHVAQALVEAGYVEDRGKAFDRLIGRNCPAYVPRAPFRPEDAIAVIHQAGGIASLAHPGKLGDPLRFIRKLKEAGLDALEAYHSDHSAAITERVLRWAERYGLAVTGGSDSHGPQCAIGGVEMPDAVGERVMEMIRRVGGGG